MFLAERDVLEVMWTGLLFLAKKFKRRTKDV